MTAARLTVVGIALVVALGSAPRPFTAAQAGPAPGRQAPSTPAVRPAWPPAPMPARIRFVRSIDPAGVRRRPSWLSKIWHAVVGAGDEPRMVQPYGIAVGPDGKIYVADTYGAAVHVFDLKNSGYSAIKVDGESLIGVALAGGRLFVTDSTTGRLLCLDAKGRTVWTRGRRDGFVRPTGLVTASDRLYVVDTGAHRVNVVSLDGTILASFGGRGAGPGQFNFPTNIARGSNGRLYVTDTMNFRVEVFSPDGSYLDAFGQLGDGAGDFDKPKGIAIDSDGHIYVVEGFNDVVQIFDPEGRLLLVAGGSGSADGQFWLPSGIAIANDMVYVADSANRRVSMFEYLKDGQ